MSIERYDKTRQIAHAILVSGSVLRKSYYGFTMIALLPNQLHSLLINDGVSKLAA